MPSHSVPPRRVLIIKPSSLGDVVHALPVLAAARRTWPRAHIAWLIASPFRALLAGHPLIDELIEFDRKRFGQAWRSPRIALELARFLRDLRRRRFDLVLDLQGLMRSSIFAAATGARRRIGFADARELAPALYTQRVRCATTIRHAVDKNIALARAAGLPIERPEFPMGIVASERAAAHEHLARSAGRPVERYLAVLPSTRWPTKTWPTTHLAALLDQLHETDYPPVVLLGGPSERAQAEQIVASTQTRPLNLVGQTSLRELAALLDAADGVICMDSGPMHIAAALGRPLVALFGPTNPARTGPYAPQARVVTIAAECAPCYRRQCPLGHHRCLQALTVEQVLREVRECIPIPRLPTAGRPPN